MIYLTYLSITVSFVVLKINHHKVGESKFQVYFGKHAERERNSFEPNRSYWSLIFLFLSEIEFTDTENVL